MMLQVCELLPAALYIFSVSAATYAQEYGPSAAIQKYTDHGIPIDPEIPAVTDVTQTTITLRLEPVILLVRFLQL